MVWIYKFLCLLLLIQKKKKTLLKIYFVALSVLSPLRFISNYCFYYIIVLSILLGFSLLLILPARHIILPLLTSLFCFRPASRFTSSGPWSRSSARLISGSSSARCTLPSAWTRTPALCPPAGQCYSGLLFLPAETITPTRAGETGRNWFKPTETGINKKPQVDGFNW